MSKADETLFTAKEALAYENKERQLMEQVRMCGDTASLFELWAMKRERMVRQLNERGVEAFRG